MEQPSRAPVRIAASSADMLTTGLRSQWMAVARVLWVILFVLNLLWFGTTFVAQVTAATHPCSESLCIVTPAQAETLSRLHISLNAFAAYFNGIPTMAVLFGAIVAVLLFWRRSDDWLALLVGLFLVIYPVTNFGLLPDPQAERAQALVTEIPDVIIYYGVFLVFPNVRFVPRWTWVLLLGWVGFIWTGTIATVFGAQVPGAAALGYPLLYLGALGAQVYRFRQVADARQRLQTKWVILGFATALIASITFWIVLPLSVPAFQQPGTFYTSVGYPIYELATVALPISFAIAIQRHQLFDLDALINRALVYGSLSAVLAAVYFGLVLGLQTLVRTVTGQSGQQPIFIVASTLAVAALFNPLRHRLQRAVDRRFYRSKYDTAKTLAAFGNTLRTETDLRELSRHLLGVVQETMQPESVSLWLAKRGDASSAGNRPG